MASIMPSPAMRVASRRIAISRGLLMERSSSRIGSRSAILDCGAIVFRCCRKASSREMRPSHGSALVLRASVAGSLEMRSPAPRDDTECRSPARRRVWLPSPPGTPRAPTRSRSRWLFRLHSGIQPGTEHHGLAPLVARIQEQARTVRAPVDRQNRPRLHHAGKVEELVGLAQRLFAGTLRSPLYDRHRVADLGHHACAPGGVFRGRKHVGNYGLRRQRQRQQEQTKSHHQVR